MAREQPSGTEETKRTVAVGRALRLEYLTVGWNLVEAAIAIAASPRLVAFRYQGKEVRSMGDARALVRPGDFYHRFWAPIGDRKVVGLDSLGIAAARTTLGIARSSRRRPRPR